MVQYLIKFTKESDIKFISHLDLMRTIQRIIRRSNIPIEYSKGFNPHMDMSIAQPLSVGMYSESEYLDIGLKEEMKEEEILQILNSNTPSKIKFKDVIKNTNPKFKNSMAMLDGASYLIKIKINSELSVANDMDNLIKKEEWETIKKGKKGDKTLDIKPLIKNMEYEVLNNILIIKATLACGSRENLSAGLYTKYISENIKEFKQDSFIDIKRLELYSKKDEKLVSLSLCACE